MSIYVIRYKKGVVWTRHFLLDGMRTYDYNERFHRAGTHSVHVQC